MKVQRVREGNGSHIEPPLDEGWTDLEKLRWHLSVALHDARLPDHLATVELGNLKVNGRTVGPVYDIRYTSVARTGAGSWGCGGFRESWSLINGIGLGFAIAHGGAL